MSEHNEGEGQLNVSELIIRRADLDDAPSLSQIVSSQELVCLDLLYNYPKVLNLIETSCLSVTVMTPGEQVLGLLVFDSTHDVITGMNDFMHENMWEEWMHAVFKLEDLPNDITPYNCLWLKYVFIAREAEGMTEATQLDIMKKVFRFVYNSSPELEFILFHLRKEASNSGLAVEYVNPFLEQIFTKLEKKDLPSDTKENLNLKSEIYVSERSFIIEVLEIRDALEQDHDDLVEICNQQSELDTKVYGEYFVAELIANQNDTRRAIVAQVGTKAKGLMSLTTDINYGFLAKNFELETYDNLCSYEYMDAIRYRREEIRLSESISGEERAFAAQRSMQDQKLICSETANRIRLQQYCMHNQNEIKSEMENFLNNEELQKKINTKDKMEALLEKWLKAFEIVQPDPEFFTLHPVTDVDLFSLIIKKKDLFLTTLTYFGLPDGYINGVGQWKDHSKKLAEKKKKDKRKQDFSKDRRAGGKRPNAGKENDENRKPDFFDLQPLLDAFKNFVDSGPEIRTKIRLQMELERKKIRLLFCHPNGEPNEERCQDILNIADHINLDLQPNQIEGFGWVLECFGGCTYTAQIIKVAEKPKEENNELKALRSKPRNAKKDLEKLVDKVIKLTSFDEFKAAIDRLAFLDETLCRLKEIEGEILGQVMQEKEEQRLARWQAHVKQVTLPPIENPYYNFIKNYNEEEMMDNIPQQAKNAVCVNIFFIEKQYDSRSVDFLNFAFDLFHSVEYIILTQPFSAQENMLLQSFIPVPKKENTNIDHTLYIFHRACLLAPYLAVRKSLREDYESGKYLLEHALNKTEFTEDIVDAISNNASNKICFSAFNQRALIGFFVMTKDVNLEYYKSHFCVQYHLLLDQYALTDHSRLLHSVINPLFQRARRFLFREILRLSNKKTLFFEVSPGANKDRRPDDPSRLLQRHEPRPPPQVSSLPRKKVGPRERRAIRTQSLTAATTGQRPALQTGPRPQPPRRRGGRFWPQFSVQEDAQH
jgi:hypothetical protein